MSWLREPLQNGEIVASEFGVGLKLDSLYTPHEILRVAVELKKGITQTVLVPHGDVKLDEYAWCRWDRFGIKAATALAARCRLRSVMPIDPKFVTQNYAGTNTDYLNGWVKYYPIEHRLKTMSKVMQARHFERKRLLDLGCAGGRHFFELAMHGFDPYGIECNPHYFNTLHPMLENRVLFGDAMLDTYWFADVSFDVVLCSAHGYVMFPELSQMFSEAARLLIYGGVLVLDIPPKGLNIGPSLQGDYRLYIRTLKDCGFRPKIWKDNQIVSVLENKVQNMASS